MILWIAGLFGILIISGLAATKYVHFIANSDPANSPFKLARSDKSHLLVCAGDSITLGTCSYPYTSDIHAAITRKGWEVCNAGINADLAWNLLQRLDPIIALQPDAITILIGSNDIQATVDPVSEAGYLYVKNLPQRPNVVWFLTNMERILTRLLSETSAKIAVLSITPNTEKVFSEPNQEVLKYNVLLKDICDKYAISFLDITSIMMDKLKNSIGSPYKTRPMVKQSPLFHYLLGKSWISISEMHRLELLIDNIHLNDRAGKLVSNEILSWLQNIKTPSQD